MFDIFHEDVKQSLKLHCKNAVQYKESFSPLATITEDKHLLFTITKDGKFVIHLKDGNNSVRGKLQFILEVDNQILPVYLDKCVKGTLVNFNGINIKEDDTGSIISYRYNGIILRQGQKYFGYNMSMEITKDGKIISTKDHIYGFGRVIKRES